MIDEKPLHVRVAEALGRCVDHTFEDLRPEQWAARCRKCGLTEGMGPGQNAVLTMDEAPRYDTDWSATGPLIEKYGLTLAKREDAEEWLAAPRQSYLDEHDGYLAYVTRPFALGPTPLLAVCNLIFLLKEAGKLNV